MKERELLLDFLEEIEKFQVAPGTKRQEVHGKQGSPYKYALLQAIVLSWDYEFCRELKKGKLVVDEILPWFRLVLIEEFPNRYQNVGTEVAQPIWRLFVTNRFWEAFDKYGNKFKPEEQKESLNSVKSVESLNKKEFSYCKIPESLVKILNDDFSKRVLGAYLSAKINTFKED